MKFSYSLIKRLLPKVPAKQKLVDAFNVHAFEVESVEGNTIDIKLYANRYSDAVSHIGIAREAAAMFGLPFKSPVSTLVNIPNNLGKVKVLVEEPELVSRYAARLFTLPTKVKPLPAWIATALREAGLTHVNTVVDVMNYVMLETGQPLHAFDADKLAKQKNGAWELKVHTVPTEEKIETLDRKHVTIPRGTLVIADADRALAIAGIKGGAHAAVHAGTKQIIVEAATFDAVKIMKTARGLKLTTDAATRFAHAISPALVAWGMDRATVLLKELGLMLEDSAEYYPTPVGEAVIPFDPAYYEQLLGGAITTGEARRRMTALGFEVTPPKKKTTPGVLVHIPAWRTDVTLPEDIIEEVARLGGYNALASVAPAVALMPASEEDMVILKDLARSILSAFGLDEVLNHSFVSVADVREDEDLEGYGVHAFVAELENPLSDDFRYLRPSLGVGLKHNIESNARFFDRINVFEIGSVFRRDERGIHESVHLGVALGGKEKGLALELKGIASELIQGLGLMDMMMREDGTALRIESDHHVIGRLRTANMPKGLHGAFLEISLTKLLPLLENEKEYRPLAKFPSVMRDLSLLLSEDVRIGRILEAIQEVGGPMVENVDLIDEYNDPAQGGRASYTFRIVFQLPDRTLTDGEVNASMEAIGQKLHGDFRAEIR